MRVPRFVGGGRIAWEEREVPAPGPGQLLLRIRANALCGSERQQFFGGTRVVPGHEASGIVAAAGPGTATPAGTPGVVYLMDFCGECRSCRLGHTNQCLAKRGDYGFNRDGGYAPYEVVSERVFFPVPPDLPPDLATLLLDVMGTSGHAVARARLLRADVESVLITGAGPVGLGLLAMWRVLEGADLPVYVTDVAGPRLALAERLGGVPIPLEEGLPAGLARLGRPEVDVAFDASGRTEARQAAVAALGRRGVLVCVGHGQTVALDVSRDLIAPERAVLGSEYFRYAELRENLPRLLAHRAYLAEIITHRFAPSELEAAAGAFFRGETGKALVVQP